MIKCAVLLRYNLGNGSKEGYHLEDGVGKKKHGQSFFESKGSSKNYDHQNCSTVRPSVETKSEKRGRRGKRSENINSKSDYKRRHLTISTVCCYSALEIGSLLPVFRTKTVEEVF